jgi:hypothetical protein
MRARVKTALALAITLPAVAGCEKSPKDRLQGQWDGQSIENLPAAHAQKATGWVKDTHLTFSGNKVTVQIPAEAARTGSFTAVRKEGDALLVVFKRDEGGRDEAEMALVGERELHWKIGQGREIVLTKKN